MRVVIILIIFLKLKNNFVIHNWFYWVFEEQQFITYELLMLLFHNNSSYIFQFYPNPMMPWAAPNFYDINSFIQYNGLSPRATYKPSINPKFANSNVASGQRRYVVCYFVIKRLCGKYISDIWYRFLFLWNKIWM